jgi:drug/metabolite transporter (DMT)-like permease
VTTPLKSILLVLTASFIGSFGAVFLKAGAGRLHREIRTLIFNWRLAAGVGMYVLSLVFYMAGIREGELSILYPMVSLGYIWTMLWSKLFFHEPISQKKVAGLALILAGIVLLNAGNR